jgi:hypothetical protein
MMTILPQSINQCCWGWEIYTVKVTSRSQNTDPSKVNSSSACKTPHLTIPRNNPDLPFDDSTAACDFGNAANIPVNFCRQKNIT